MKQEDFFKKNKYPLIILLITFIFFVYCYWKSAMGLFFDIPAMFSGVFHKYTLAEGELEFLYYIQHRIRLFTDILVAIPFNTVLPFLKNEPALTFLKAYSTSYFVIHFIFLILNYLIAKRTKRYDIAVLAFAFYFLFSIPNAIWVVRELHIAMLAYFIILNYFLSEQKLNWLDLIFILLIQTYLFEAFETSAVFGFLMFIFSIIYIYKKELRTNLIHKIVIGITSLAIAIYIPMKLFYLQAKNELGCGTTLSDGLTEWLRHFEISFFNIFSGNLLVPFFAVLMIIFLFFYKKELDKKSIISIIIYVAIAIITVFIRTNFISNPRLEIVNYTPILLFLFPVMITVLLIDYLKITVDKKFFHNLLIVTCIFGFINLLWQINSTNDFTRYKEYIENLINKSETTIVNIPKEDFVNNNTLRYLTCFGITPQSLFLQTRNKPAKIILPQKDWIIYDNSCAEDIGSTFYDANKDNLRLQACHAEIETNYWDLNPIKEEFIRTGRVKN